MLYLILVELAEILHIHIVSLGINDSCEAVELDLVIIQVLNSDDNIGELAYSGWLDEDSVRVILLDNLIKSLSEITYECAADASCNHLVDLDSGLSQKSGIYSDLSEFVLDKNDILVLITLSNKLLDESRLTCSEKSRKNVDFCHVSLPLFLYINRLIYWHISHKEGPMCATHLWEDSLWPI